MADPLGAGLLVDPEFGGVQPHFRLLQDPLGGQIALRVEDGGKNVVFFLPCHKENSCPCFGQCPVGQGNPGDSPGNWGDGKNHPMPVFFRRRSRKEAGRVSVGSDPEKGDIQGRRVGERSPKSLRENLFISEGFPFRVGIFPLDSENGFLLNFSRNKESLPRHPVIALVALRRNAPFVGKKPANPGFGLLGPGGYFV